jgi:nicotinamidase-related amidase
MSAETALLIVDVQLGMFESPLMPPVYAADALLSRIGDLIMRARVADVPVIYVQHSGGEGHPLEHGTAGWQVHPVIAPLGNELVIQKRTPDSFHETSLARELEARRIKRLVLTGIQTDYCVDTTCRRAFSLGYEVTLASDAHSTWDTKILTAQQIIDHHNEILGSWFAALKETGAIDFEENQKVETAGGPETDRR